ncbi:MAG: hypothetical protein K6A23_06355 [Butyrivibrio sp.]|nr:hypothetical protein [Butyrivibrio sp.]
MNYLSGEELQKLIASAEQDDYVQAPPELMENILKELDKSDTKSGENKKVISIEERNKKISEYRKYTFKVFLATAACVILSVISQISSFGKVHNIDESYNNRFEYKTKQEVMEENKTMYQTLKETDLFANIGITED